MKAVFFLTIIGIFFLAAYIMRKKEMYLWLGGYLFKSMNFVRNVDASCPIHIMFCIADHFEPEWNNAPYEVAASRVDRWVRDYPSVTAGFRDSDGMPPRYTFFYPQEEYRREHLEKLSRLCKKGLAEVEVHLHHDNDTEEGLRIKIEDYKDKLVRHDLLSYDKEGRPRYGFIHGNWALNNSRRDGRCCGVNDEARILKDTGCYADFTLPSAPSNTQTRKINSIYYAKSSPGKAKGHNTGVDAAVGKKPDEGLMMIQGPLTLNWKRLKWGLFPGIENGELSYKNPPAKERIDLWIKEHIHVLGNPNWIFVKVYTHGAQEKNADMLLGKSLREMFKYLSAHYNDGKYFKLHYVTAREMYNIVKAAEAGLGKNPGEYRDYMLKKDK